MATESDPRSGRPDPRTIPREREDPRVSPLGRGANPGSHDGTSPLSGGPSTASPRGAAVPGATTDGARFVHRENEDVTHRARHDAR